MRARAGVYVRADIEGSADEGPDDGDSQLGGEDQARELTFVDLHTRSGTPFAEQVIERMTAAVQDRLERLSSTNQVLFRWPWLLGPDDVPDTENIDRWLDRLTDTSQGEPVISSSIGVGVIQHRIGGAPTLHLADEASADRGTILALAREIELQELLKNGRAVWAPKSYHYRLPSGEHTDKFIRFADAIQSPRDAYVVATWLLERLATSAGIVVDTGGLTPVLMQLESLLARCGWSLGPTAILKSYPTGRPAVRRTVESAISGPDYPIIGIQSVSSTGNLQNTFLDELQRTATSYGLQYSYDVLVDRRAGPETSDRFAPDDESRVVSWLGLGESLEAGQSGSCSLCGNAEKARVVAVDPRSYRRLEFAEPHLIMPDVGYALQASAFWERVASREGLAIEANPHPRSRVARGKRTALTVRLMFELVVDDSAVDDSAASPRGLEALVRARCAKLKLPEGIEQTVLVVAPEGDFKEVDRPAFKEGEPINLEEGLRATLAGIGIDRRTPVVAFEDAQLPQRIANLDSGDRVLIFSWGTITGLTLRRATTAVAEAVGARSNDLEIIGLVFHGRTSTPGEWTAQVNQFGRIHDRRRPRPPALGDVTAPEEQLDQQALVALWNSCFPWESPLVDEYRLLDPIRNEFSGAAKTFVEQRIRFLEFHSTYSQNPDDWSPRFDDSGGPSPTHVFWGMSRDELHQTHVRGRSLYGKNLDCLTAYAAIGSVIQYSRLNARPAAAPRWVMFELGRIVRSYFDALILISMIRWMRPGELWWATERDSPESVRDSVAYLLDQACDHPSEQILLVPELLLAAAQGKVPRFAHGILRTKAQEISDGWPVDEKYGTARGAVAAGLALLDPC